MTRRQIIHMLPGLAASPGFVAFFAQWLEAAAEHDASAHRVAPPEPPYWRDYQPKFFGYEDFAALQAFTEILIPTDETPGAREAHCAHFIDFVLDASRSESPELGSEWRDAMAKLRQLGFHTAEPRGRAALVEAISSAERDPSRAHPAFSAFRLIKHETVFAFYTSRAGMIDALDYRGNSYNVSFPACEHPEHYVV